MGLDFGEIINIRKAGGVHRNNFCHETFRIRWTNFLGNESFNPSLLGRVKKTDLGGEGIAVYLINHQLIIRVSKVFLMAPVAIWKVAQAGPSTFVDPTDNSKIKQQYLYVVQKLYRGTCKPYPTGFLVISKPDRSIAGE